METLLSVLIVLLLVAVLVIGFFLYRLSQSLSERGNNRGNEMLLLQQQLQELSRTLDAKMGETTRTMHKAVETQFSESQKLIRDISREVNEQMINVTKGVSQVSESNTKIFAVGEQLQNLEKVLLHQKQRGNLGEASLQLALENMLPPGTYRFQYQFPGGDTVDAVIETPHGLIPIDAKFSLDNYRRLVDESDENRRKELEKEFTSDLKKRIDETAKYIRPKDGTLGFAFMYIPAEAIYYDLLVNEVGAVKVNTRSLIDYAHKDKNVIIVSPTTLVAYLHTVMHGLRALKFEESTKQVSKWVEALSRHLKAYEEYFDKMGNALGTTVSHYNAAQKEFGKIDKDVLRITGEGIGTETLLIDKPQKEE